MEKEAHHVLDGFSKIGWSTRGIKVGYLGWKMGRLCGVVRGWRASSLNAPQNERVSNEVRNRKTFSGCKLCKERLDESSLFC